ncbi:MAG: response regulator transcription factor [Pseudomonadota bacterium]
MAIRLLLVEDDAPLRRIWSRTLPQQGEFEVVAAAADEVEALALLEATRADVALVDLSLPRGDGVSLIQAISRRWRELRVVVVSGDSSPRRIRAAVHAGADGYVLKGASMDELATAIRLVASGQHHFSEPLLPFVFAEFVAFAQNGVHGLGLLTAREGELLRLLALGRSNGEAATEMGCSIKTIERHRSSLVSKLGLRTAAELTRFAVRHGLVPDIV